MELRLLYIFAFVGGTMLAASVGATGDSRLKRSEDSPEPNREAGGGKPLSCGKRCGQSFPNKGQEVEAYFCKHECEKGNVEWSRPSEGLKSKCKIRIPECRMAAEGCNDLCEKQCKAECDNRFMESLYKNKGDLLLCKASCTMKIRELREAPRETQPTCDQRCGRFFPNTGQEHEAWLCEGECEKGNLEWNRPSKKVGPCMLTCKMTKRGCFERCQNQCAEECDGWVIGAGNNLRLCKSRCTTEIRDHFSTCDKRCGWFFPDKEQANEAGICEGECKKGNFMWNRPAKKVGPCVRSCGKAVKKTVEECEEHCNSKCDADCDSRFLKESLLRVSGADYNLRLCHGYCTTEIRRVGRNGV